MRLIDTELGGMIPLEVVLTSDTPGRFVELDVYTRVVEIEQFAAQEPEILLSRSYADLIREMFRRRKRSSELGPDGKPRALEEKDLVSQDRRLRQFAEAFHYHALITKDGKQARILLRMREIGTRDAGKLIDRLESQLAASFPPGVGIEARVTGDGYLNARRMDRFVHDLFSSLLMAAATMFVLVALLLRSLRLGLIAVLPNLTPLCVTLGYMALRGYDMSTSNVIVFAISLGIGVDDTIHFLSRFRTESHRGGDVPAMIRRTLEGTGRAIVVTSLLVLVGLGVLLFSEFVPTRRFAELTSVTIAGALLGDLLLLPACVSLWWREPKQ